MQRVQMWMVVVLALTTALLGGCGGQAGIGAYDVTLTMDPSLAAQPGAPSIPVNLLAVNETEKPAWDGKNMNQYWDSSDTDRQSSARFTVERPLSKASPIATLQKNDPVWTTWKNEKREWLFVTANLPAGGGQKVVLPLRTDRWPQGAKIQILVQEGQLQVQTPPLPPKEK